MPMTVVPVPMISVGGVVAMRVVVSVDAHPSIVFKIVTHCGGSQE